MRRRVARVVRVALFAFGLLCLAWWALSADIYLGVEAFSFDSRGVLVASMGCIEIVNGLALVAVSPADLSWSIDVDFEAKRLGEARWYYPRAPLPGVETLVGGGATRIVIPLWLLAVICLAWPVTSLILARRKYKHGFSVEPKPPDAAVPQ